MTASAGSSPRTTSEASEGSFVLASEDFLPFDENVEPIATEQELAEYREQVAQEEEEDEILWSRFSGKEDVENWFVMFFVIFMALVDRKRFSGPLTSGKVAYTFTQSTLQNLIFSHVHALNYPRTFACLVISIRSFYLRCECSNCSLEFLCIT